MKTSFYHRRIVRLVLLLALTAALSADATVTNLACWRFGENDPGAVNGGAAAGATNLVGGQMNLAGSPVYTGNVAATAANAVGSALALQFTAGKYGTNALVSTLVNNFGLELWVKPDATNANQCLAYNGVTGGGGAGGWGLYLYEGKYQGLFGGVAFVTGPAAVPGVWTHLALVRDNGTTTLYVNGAIANSITAAPNLPSGRFAVAVQPQALNAEFFAGALDEARVFGFAPGGFSTNDLLFNFHGFHQAPIAGLPQVFESSVAWADYDNDGRLDFLLTGFDGANGISQLWRNTDGGFTNVTAAAFPADSLAAVRFSLAYIGYHCSPAWGDYDNDGRLDLLIAGEDTNNAPVIQLWRNTDGGFTNLTATAAPGLPKADFGALAWGDYDNDGRLDILLIGADADNIPIFQLWRNTGSGFTNATAAAFPNGAPPGVWFSSVAWADYDNDGRLDFLLTGATNGSLNGGISQLWRNTGGGFTNVPLPGVPAVSSSSVAWADYDNDGRLDFLLMGTTNGSPDGGISQLWRNTGGGFTNLTSAAFPNGAPPGVVLNSAAWGDFDNDGRLDFLLTGTTSGGAGGPVSQLWRNTGGGFTNVTASLAPSLPQIQYGSVAWGDSDNDGRLDFLLTGTSGSFTTGISQLWRNNASVTNAPPAAPTGLALTATTNAVMLSWNSAPDDHTSAAGLTYNVRAGTTPGGANLLAAHVNAANGFRRVLAMGNAMLRHTLPLTGLANGQTVYWSVQAVDTAFAGGAFAAETSVVSIPQLAIAPGAATNAVVSWTPPTWGWRLEETPSLNPAGWINSASGELNPTDVSLTNGATFYRLSSW